MAGYISKKKGKTLSVGFKQTGHDVCLTHRPACYGGSEWGGLPNSLPPLALPDSVVIVLISAEAPGEEPGEGCQGRE